MANGYSSSLISSLITNPRWYEDLGGLSSVTLLGLVVAAQPLGCIAAFIPAPWLSDNYGRRAGIISGSLVMTGAFIGQVFCRTPGQFLAMRLIAGFASIFNTMSSSALLLELAHRRQKAIMGSFFSTFWLVGAVVAAWTSYGSLTIPSSWSWRLPVTVQLLWTVLQLALIPFCPESPHWLAAHGKEEQAKAILATFHANGDINDPFVLSEFEDICAAAVLADRRGSVGWSALFATSGNRKRLAITIAIALATQWVGNGVITFYLAPVLRTVGITSSFKQQGINGGLQIYNWVLASGASLLAEKVGRRRLFLTSTSTMLVFMSIVTICSALYSTTRSVAAGYAVVVCLFLFLGGYVIGLSPIPILYINEIWPYHLKAKGTSVFWMTQAAATCFNQYVNPIALQRIMWKYYLVYVGVLVAVTVFVFCFVPETKGMSLEEVSRLFDGRTVGAVELSVAHGREINTHGTPREVTRTSTTNA
jgi:sugar porter (SP) family MFS transporter